MSCNSNNCFDEALGNSSFGGDCGCNRERECGCGDHGAGNDGCGCSRKEYLGKSVTETKYFRVKTKRFVPSENACGCGCCR